MRLPMRPALALLCLLTVAPITAGCNVQISNQAEARSAWTRTYTLTPDGEFEIRNTNGQVRVEATDGDKVEVTADRIVRAGTEDAAKKELERMAIDESVAPDRISLDATNKGLGFVFNLNRRVDFTVKLPRGARLSLSQTNGSVDIDGVTGLLKVETTNGSVKASGLQEGADISSTNGAVTLDFAKVGSSGIRTETTNGSITIVLPRETAARISARVTNGGISTGDLPIAITEQSRRRLEATLGSGGPAVRLESTNGAISLSGR